MSVANQTLDRQSQPGSLRQQLKRPFEDVLPPLSADELATLKLRVKDEGGIHDSILITEDDEILDGHNRTKIPREKYRTQVIAGSADWSDAQKRAFVFRAGRGKRQMSAEQWKERGVPIAKALAKESWRQEDIAEALGVDRTTISRWLPKKRNGKVGNNVQLHTVSHLDCRVKIPATLKPIIAKRVNKGEAPASIASELKVSKRRINQIVTAEKKADAKRASRAAPADVGVIVGDFREVGDQVEDASVSLIFTDPPYNEDAIELYGALSEFAARVLVPGGWCLAYSGHSHLPQVMAEMCKSLTYGWTHCIVHTGGDTRFRKFKLFTGWKPIIACYKPPLNAWWDWFADTTSGGREKDTHKWQQAESEAAHFIKAMTVTDAVVCDPFVGSGTSCVAAKRLGRRWIGIEKEQESADKAAQRIAETEN